MGEIAGLTEKQALIFQQIVQDSFFTSQFYFTGGTALSAFYLHHRESEDLDFFSEKPFDTQVLASKIVTMATKNNFTFQGRERENVYVYYLTFADKEVLKIDFVTHPHQLLEKGKTLAGFRVDSLIDIATNKLLTINQRTQVKDFVDLYFLLRTFTIWDIINGLGVKYRMKTDPYLVAMDFVKVEEFEFLPGMLVPLTLAQLQTFFKEKAIELGRRVVE